VTGVPTGLEHLETRHWLYFQVRWEIKYRIPKACFLVILKRTHSGLGSELLFQGGMLDEFSFLNQHCGFWGSGWRLGCNLRGSERDRERERKMSKNRNSESNSLVLWKGREGCIINQSFAISCSVTFNVAARLQCKAVYTSHRAKENRVRKRPQNYNMRGL
jgi:hypothetical protein